MPRRPDTPVAGSLATGVLPLCFGEATKFSQYLLDADKGYSTVAQLGVTPPTGDAEGEVLERRAVAVDEAAIQTALPAFRGQIEQIRRCIRRSSATVSRCTSWRVPGK